MQPANRMTVRTPPIIRAILPIAMAIGVWCATLGADGAEAGADEVWRSIFARPAATPVDKLEFKRQALGAALFADRRLSRDGDRSCATCHRPEHGFADGLPKARGRDGTPLKRNTPHLFNLAGARSFYWDGREPTLEAQARVPLYADNELGAVSTSLLPTLQSDADTQRRFADAFPESGLTEAAIIAALAAYERSIVSPVTRFDDWIAGNAGALNDEERRGFRIFAGKGGCVSCHGGWRMTDDAFHDIGLKSDDPGRAAVAGGTPGIPAFKTPGLRQVAKTAPYMHDGSLATLDDVVAHYAGGLLERPSLAPNLVRDLDLDPSERAALVAFLKTL